MTVGKIQGIDIAVAIGIGKRLQVNGIDIKLFNAFNQNPQVFILLYGIGIVNIIQIHMNHPGSWRIIIRLPHPGQLLTAGIGHDQFTVNNIELLQTIVFIS